MNDKLKFSGRPYLISFLLLYTMVLIFSWAVQYTFPVIEKKNIYYTESTHQIEDSEVIAGRYFLQNDEAEMNVFILPDLLKGAEFMLPLAESIQTNANVHIIHYPEEDSEGNTISHSVETRAKIVKALIDEHSFSNVHFLAHGYGGLVAVHCLAEYKDQSNINSLALLSSYGPVEFHLMGNETINRYMYALMQPVLTIFKNMAPHFGWYHHQTLKAEKIRAFRQMNQADFREQVKHLDLPVHIMHPLYDNYVSPQVSVENNRIIPQSTFATYGANQESIYMEPTVWAEQLEWFWQWAADGTAHGRREASSERLQLAENPFDADTVISLTGGPLILIMLIIIFFCFMSEDLTCISAGLLTAGGILDLQFAMAACFMGILLTDSSSYFLGRKAGRPLISKIPFKWIIKESDVERVENLMSMHGMKIIFITRFLPGTRLPTYIAAGMLKTKFRYFVIYFILAIAVWVPLVVGLSSFLGRPMLNFVEAYRDFAFLILLAIVILIYSLLKLFVPLLTVTGRRRFIVKFERFRERYSK